MSAPTTTTDVQAGTAAAPAKYSVSWLSRHFSFTARGVLLISATLMTATVFMSPGTRLSRSARSSARPAAGRAAATQARRSREVMGYLGGWKVGGDDADEPGWDSARDVMVEQTRFGS